MKSAPPPRYEARRAKELEAELLERARGWIPQWGLDDDSSDFGCALLKVAARFASEVAERLDRGGEKLRLGFLDWLAVPTEAARPARLPVVFKLTDSARDAKPAAAPTKLQVEAADTSVILETETDVLVLPRGLQVVVGVDGAADAFYLPPPGLSNLAPLEPVPTQWQFKSFASAGATKVQLDPPQGLVPEILIGIGGQQYRVTEVKKDIVTLDPPLISEQAAQAGATKVTVFAPFDPAACNRQEHVLYLGHKELFDIDAAATIEVLGARTLAGVAWHYWGKTGADEEIKWQALGFADAEVQAKAEGLVLAKPKGSIEVLELVKGTQSRWIRASVLAVDAGQAPLLVDDFEIRVNCGHGASLHSSADPADAPSIEAMANTTPLVLDTVFFPFGKDPRQFDTFYVGSKEAFSKKGADVTLAFDIAATNFTATNPELSWEYWTGTGWWKLGVTRDATLNLKLSGKLEFKVPRDLAPTDWSGRTNYWIRARLVGGDYGRERVSVSISRPDPVTHFRHQTFERSAADILAPSVVKLRVSYEICESVLPTFVFTKESGSWRDQSDANFTGGPKVESFVPLAVMLARLSGTPATSAATEDCPADCECPGTVSTDPASASSNAKNDPAAATESAASSSSASAAYATVTTPASAQGRALYLGFDAPLLGEPINVLLLVEERPHDQFAPITVEALIADRFVPIAVNDTTRALGESGILTLAFPIQPTPRELFGQTLSWLRLSPAPGASPADWKPKVLGAHLNGVWARAAETVTHELLGSSLGEPNLTLFLARPPVLRNTLELRVKEPLGEEEIAALNAERNDRVLNAVAGLPGQWVLWGRVIDPGDEAPDARVYALDEVTGEVRFGDGRHGKIPPVERDSIMAFTYRRTEPGAAGSLAVPGNAITARTSLNLVSPIDGVEAVFAADQAAGGVPPEDVDRVLHFGVASLRHRGRAVTAEDVEDLVRASDPDIAQARCFLRNGFVQVVVVMRGTNPIPNTAQVRELHRLLVSEAPPSLAADQALRIVGPTLRRLRVDLRLRVASLDNAGAVAREARKRIIALFDAATGGIEGEGWTLGENPTDSDIAVVLADVPLLEGIADASSREVADDGTEQEWPVSLKRTELPRLEKDGVRIEFETVEVVA